MTFLVLEQALNGLQFGVMLFLMAAGLTLVFGIMNLINLAHGSLYMVGAYVSAWTFSTTGSLVVAVSAALSAALVTGIIIEVVLFRALYTREHLDQVLGTFGLTLFFNEMVRVIWGPAALYSGVPKFLAGQIEIFPGALYPTYRLAVIAVGIAVALILYFVVSKTRTGMLIRAGANNRVMVSALGVNIVLLYTLVFGLGAVLAALSGIMAAPIFSVESGMGENVLILAFVVIVVGGIGSIRGAFIAALLIGLVDTLGRTLLGTLLTFIMSPAAANNAGPALASMLIYIFMAAVLFFRPKGLFPAQGS
jgi:branched-chain amino acid transport system permease protein